MTGRHAPVAERLWRRVDASGDCWLWTGSIKPTGYGQIRLDTAAIESVHQLSWELLVGPVPAGMVLDHQCRVRRCVNPDHLVAVTPAAMTRRNSVGSPTPADRFWAKVDASGDCWLWTGARKSEGYGSFSIRHGDSVYAHRFAYQQLVGPIPAGLQLDHLCRVRNCVNPDHLEPVERKVNILRGQSPAAIHARKSTCRNGHPFDAVGATGNRRCLTCERASYDPAKRAAKYRAVLARRAA